MLKYKSHLHKLNQFDLYYLQKNTLEAIEPPLLLLPKEFTRDYRNKEEVLLANDLSVKPTVNAPCITVLIQDIALYLENPENN